MNPLEEYPHLFGNGKFEIRYGEGEIWEYDYLLDGVVNRMGLLLIVKDKEKPKEYEEEPENCTLIARPIEDMTDEEVFNSPLVKNVFGDDEEQASTAMEMIRHFAIHSKTGYINFSDANYLLSIGVYPFDQQAFEDGTVIKKEQS